MAACAKILHLRCVEYARRENVRVHAFLILRQGRYVAARAEGRKLHEQAIISGVVMIGAKPRSLSSVFQTGLAGRADIHGTPTQRSTST